MSGSVLSVDWSGYGGVLVLWLALLCFLFSITFLSTSIRAQLAIKSTEECKKTPAAPYWIPLLGHLVSFFWSLDSLFTGIANSSGGSYPVRIALGTEEVILLTGAANLKYVWKHSQWLTAKAGHLIGLRTILGTPERSMPFYRADNSGIGKEALRMSNVPPEQRVWHLTHQPIVDCLSGANLSLFTDTFQNSMIKRIKQYPFNDEWTDLADLFTFIYSEVMQVQLELLCGTFFLEQSPTFVQDFRRFHHAMVYLKEGLPQWMTPRSCRARNVCRDSVKKWHAALREHDHNMLVDTGEIQNPRFGNEIMRSRRRIMAKMEVMDDETAACADLGMLWALNANPATASFWLLVEIIRDPTLHSALHDAIVSAAPSSIPPFSRPNSASANHTISTSSLSVSILNDNHLLQAMYAETLRLRISTLIIQSAEFGDFNFKGWLLPKDKLILISSRIAHMDRESWRHINDEGEEIPTDEFCVDRFLNWKNDDTPRQVLKSSEKHEGADGNGREKQHGRNRSNIEQAHFTMAGMAGKWIPYGGGPGICPGRHFAKNIMLLSSALIFSAFEIELKVEKDWKPQMDMRYYGLGVLPPRGKIPFRIRRRWADSERKI